MRMARELLHPPRPMQGDETVAELVERHFGAEVVDRLADPLLCRRLWRRCREAERTRCLAALRRNGREVWQPESRHDGGAQEDQASSRPAAGRPLFTSLKDGMQQMVDAIVARLNPESIRLRHYIRRVYPENSGWRVAIEMNGDERYDAVILATPANVAGRCWTGVDRALSRDLLDITYSSSVTVTLGYYKEQLAKLPPGFGFLVPRSEGTRLLACTFVHNKFPHRAPADKGILRCFLGGARDEAVLGLTDEEMLETVCRELKNIVNLDVRPIFARVYRWREAMAQYEPGHIARVEKIEKRAHDLPGPGTRRQRLSWHRRARLHSLGQGSGRPGSPADTPI